MSAATGRQLRLLRRGRVLEAATLAWNVVGIAVLAVAAVTARSVALAGFGLDSLIEVGASTVSGNRDAAGIAGDFPALLRRPLQGRIGILDCRREYVLGRQAIGDRN